jgi:hypothetical protein
MEGGWTRYYDFIFGCIVICSEWPTSSLTSGDIFDSTLRLTKASRTPESWLSQANHVFNRLGITSNFEEYGASETSLGQFLINPFNKCSWTAFVFMSQFHRLRKTPP